MIHKTQGTLTAPGRIASPPTVGPRASIAVWGDYKNAVAVIEFSLDGETWTTPPEQAKALNDVSRQKLVWCFDVPFGASVGFHLLEIRGGTLHVTINTEKNDQ